jgi:GNAT superfamily N-acetyltransferase
MHNLSRGKIMAYDYIENNLTAKEFLQLGESVGWGKYWEEAEPFIEKALSKSLYNVKVKDGEHTIGMGRLVGDGCMAWYIHDVVVQPEYQGKKIGSEIIRKLVGYAKQQDTNAIVRLTAAIGKETFYQKLGFQLCPNGNDGAGMAARKI